MNILITICARGGSKGIPGKNILPINNVPLIGYSINCAKKFALKYFADITLSTDDNKIKTTAAEFDLQTDYQRPDILATDTSGKIDVIKDVLVYEENKRQKSYDYILDLDVTSPLRTVEDLEKGIQIVKENENCVNLFSVSPANRNPYFNMVEKKENGYFGLIKEGVFKTRQSAPPVYDMNASFYFYKRTFFDNNYKTAITDKSLIYVMPHVCFDLDHSIDFDFMGYLVEQKKLGFEL